jgi:expansin (peptidoglycan-binding protein)
MRHSSVLVLVVAAVAACSSSGNGGSGADAGKAGGGSGGAGSSGVGSSGAGSSGAGSSSGQGGSTSSSNGGSSGSAGDDGSAASSSGGGSANPSDGSTPVVTSSGDGGVVLYGQAYTDGVYNLGPVDYSESQYHNACAPTTKYDSRVQAVEGVLLAGLWNGIANTDHYCDSCIWVVTGKGKSAMLRVVTYGDTTNDSIDTSPQAYTALTNGEYPRSMTWQFAKCPDTGPMMYEFQTAASEYWTSLWVRNARVPLTKIEVKSANHAQWTELTRGNGDGTATDASGFGNGTFSIRSTGMDGQQVTDTFAWPTNGLGSAFLTGKGNFQ